MTRLLDWKSLDYRYTDKYYIFTPDNDDRTIYKTFMKDLGIQYKKTKLPYVYWIVHKWQVTKRYFKDCKHKVKWLKLMEVPKIYYEEYYKYKWDKKAWEISWILNDIKKISSTQPFGSGKLEIDEQELKKILANFIK